MTSIDERIVAMSFENRVFEANVARTMQTLGKLDATLAKVGSTTGFADIDKAASKVTLGGPMSALDKLKARIANLGSGNSGFSDIEKASNKVELRGLTTAADKAQAKLGQLSAGSTFTDIEAASNKVELNGLTRAIDGAANKFSILEGAAAVALGNIATKAAAAGKRFGGSFTIGPIKQGLEEYQTNLNSIQTILANTDGQKVSGLDEVNKHLQELNKYSDQTIYNFSEMAKNIGTFTAAGVDLDTSTQSIKGIANLAALSGSSSQQASTAMYQLSQAIAAGRVSLQDWNSVVNAGMGGRKFQNALIQTGIAMGTIEKSAVKVDKATGKATINGQSFREAITAKPGQTSWLTDGVLTTTLSTFTGDLTKAQLKAKGFNDEQIKSIQRTAYMAKQAATQVKTLPQVFDVAKETIGSGWAQTFQLVFGNFKQARKTFTELSNFINGKINESAKARNDMLKEFDRLGGRDKIINALKTAFQALAAALKPIYDAFRDIFPAKTANDLLNMVNGFQRLAEAVRQFFVAHADQLERTFKGFFAVLHIGQTVVKTVIGLIGKLFGVVGKNSGGFLDITAAIGDFLAKLDEAISKGGNLGDIFKGLTPALKTPIALIQNLQTAIGSLFSGDGIDLGNKFVGGLHNARIELSPLQKIVLKVKDAFDRFKEALSGVTHFLQPIFSKAVDVVTHFGDMLSKAFDAIDYDKVVDGLQVGLTGGIFLMLKKLLGGGGGLEVKFFDGIRTNVVKTLDSLTGSLNAMQKNIQANTLLQIATALGVLGAGVFLISKVDPKRLGSSMTAIAVGLGQLVGALHLLGGIGGPSVIGKLAGAAGLPLLAASMVIISGALVVLAGAVKLFSTMSWKEIERGLVGVGGSLLAIKVGIQGMGPVGAIAASIIPLAIGINILAAAVRIFGGMSWEDLEKGLLGVVGALKALSAGLSGLIGAKGLLAVGPALILIATGLNIMAAAVLAFGSMDLGTLAKGILAVSISMQKLAYGVLLFPKGMFVQAASVAILAVALNGLATAVGIFGNLKVSTLVKGIVAMGQALKVLGLGLIYMEGTLPGTAALLGAAVAFTLLVPSLALMGNLKWATIFKGLAGLALTLGVIAVAGVVAAPALVAIGAALLTLGLGVAAISSGIYILAKGIALLTDGGQKGITLLLSAMTAFVLALPQFLTGIVTAIAETIGSIAKILPQVVESIGIIIGQLAAIIVQNAPKVAIAIGSLVDAMLTVLVEKGPPIFNAGMKLLQTFLTGLSQNIGSITVKVALIVQRFLDAMASKAPALAQSGGNLLRAWLNGFTKQLPSVIAAAFRTVNTFLTEVARHLPEFVHSGGTIVVKFLNGLTKEIPRIVSAGAETIIAFLDGISRQFGPLADKATDVIIRFLRAISKPDNVSRVVEEGLNTVIRFINGITKGLRDSKFIGKLLDAFYKLGKELANQVLSGLEKVRDKVADVLNPFYDGKKIARQQAESEKTLRDAHVANTRILLANMRRDGKLTEAEMKKLAEFAGGGYAGEIARQAINMERATRKAVKRSVKGAKDELKIKSPSRVFMEIGAFVVEGMSEGLQGLPGALDKGIAQPLKQMIKIAGDQSKIGKFLDKDFLKGIFDIGDTQELSASQQKVKEVFAGLRSTVKESQQGLKDEIGKQRGKLKELMSVEPEKRDQEAITKLFRAIGKNEELLKQARDATGKMFDSFSDERKALLLLADSYDTVLERLQQVQDFIKTTAEQYNQLPDFDVGLQDALDEMDLTAQEREEKRRKRQEDANKRARIDQVANYKKALQEQIEATQKYNETLEKLKSLGLDDETYKKLLNDGIKDQDFASQLLKGGKESIEELKKLDEALQKESESLAQNAADQLYNAGIHTAEGLVAGLQQQAEQIKAVMNGIAQSMVNTIKKQLGIKSPSRVFAQLGAFTTQGFANGLKGSTQSVVDAAADIGDRATSALSESLNRVSDGISAKIDPDITIRPVLDLSNVENGAKKMSGMLGDNVVPITAATSYGQASAISKEASETESALAELAAQRDISVTFEQNNTSPDKLSEIEIYRQTNNQLAQLKRALPGLMGVG